MSHSIIPPSGAHIWAHCTGSVVMAQAGNVSHAFDEHEAAAGTATHELAAPMITIGSRGGSIDTSLRQLIGAPASNGVIVTREMYDCAMLYASDVVTTMREARVFGGDYLGTEQRIDCPSIHPLSHGSCDQWIYDRVRNHIYLWEYKNGHADIPAVGNLQAVNYLSGILDRFDIGGHLDQKTRVSVRVVQPRSYSPEGPIKRWDFMASDVRGMINKLHDAAHVAVGATKATCVTGEQCRWCKSRGVCAAARDCGLALYETTTHPLGVKLSTEGLSTSLALVRRAAEQIACLEVAYSAELKMALRGGARSHIYEMAPSVGRESWKCGPAETIAVCASYGVDADREATITPKQAVAAGVPADVVALFTERKNKGFNLKKIDKSLAPIIFGAKQPSGGV